MKTTETSRAANDVYVGNGPFRYRVDPRWTIPADRALGEVVGVAYVQDGDELLLITQQGMILRTQANDVRSIGRATQGVKLIDIEPDDKVVSIARLVEKEEE